MQPAGARAGLCALRLLALFLVACTPGGGSPNGVPPPAGLDRGTLLADLSDAQKAALCDWGNDELLGGYAKTEYCNDDSFNESLSTAPSQAACVASFGAACTMTVGTYEDCVDASGGTACGFLMSSSCVSAFGACVGP